jgi:hypothetical protein
MPEELENALRLIEECRITGLESTSSYDRGTTVAEIRTFRGDNSQVFYVSDLSREQVRLFRQLEGTLKLDSMRCPFPISLDGKELDACVYEQESLKKQQQKLQQERPQ